MKMRIINENLLFVGLIAVFMATAVAGCSSQRAVNMGAIDSFDSPVKVVVVKIVDTVRTQPNATISPIGYIAKYKCHKICIYDFEDYDNETAPSDGTAIKIGKYYIVALYGPARMPFEYNLSRAEYVKLSKKQSWALTDAENYVCLNMKDGRIYPVTNTTVADIYDRVDDGQLPLLKDPGIVDYRGIPTPLKKADNITPPEYYISSHR